MSGATTKRFDNRREDPSHSASGDDAISDARSAVHARRGPTWAGRGRARLLREGELEVRGRLVVSSNAALVGIVSSTSRRTARTGGRAPDPGRGPSDDPAGPRDPASSTRSSPAEAPEPGRAARGRRLQADRLRATALGLPRRDTRQPRGRGVPRLGGDRLGDRPADRPARRTGRARDGPALDRRGRDGRRLGARPGGRRPAPPDGPLRRGRQQHRSEGQPHPAGPPRWPRWRRRLADRRRQPPTRSTCSASTTASASRRTRSSGPSSGRGARRRSPSPSWPSSARLGRRSTRSSAASCGACSTRRRSPPPAAARRASSPSGRYPEPDPDWPAVPWPPY